MYTNCTIPRQTHPNHQEYIHPGQVCPCYDSSRTYTSLYMQLLGVGIHTFWYCKVGTICSDTSCCSELIQVREVGSSILLRYLSPKPSSRDHEVMGRSCQQANIGARRQLGSWPDVCEGQRNHDTAEVWWYPWLSDSICSCGHHWCWCTEHRCTLYI